MMLAINAAANNHSLGFAPTSIEKGLAEAGRLSGRPLSCGNREQSFAMFTRPVPKRREALVDVVFRLPASQLSQSRMVAE